MNFGALSVQWMGVRKNEYVSLFSQKPWKLLFCVMNLLSNERSWLLHSSLDNLLTFPVSLFTPYWTPYWSKQRDWENLKSKYCVSLEHLTDNC